MSLQLVQVTRRFGNQLALDGVSLHVRRGDCYGFIGHNGAGKTTAMRIALGLQRASSGAVIVDGFDAARFPREARARMGGLIESPGFHGARSGRSNLECLARLQGLSRAEARQEAGLEIERVGLASAGDKAVQHYSQGMRQRLGIAQALLGQPAYVLLDEPTNGLDPEGIAEVRALCLRLVREEAVTILVSSHQLNEVAGLCNRIGVLRRGRLLVEEKTATLLSQGASRYELETSDRERAQAVLARLSVHCAVRAQGDGRGLWLEMGETKPEVVARQLVAAGVGLRVFAPHPPNLEEIYLRFSKSAEPAGAEPARMTTLPEAHKSPTQRRAPPRAVLRTMRYEATRLARRASVPLLFALPALLACIAVLRRASEARSDAQAMGAAKLFSATNVTAFEGLGVALQSGLPLLAILTVGLSSQSIASELARGTLRNVLMRPLTRVDAALGKALTLIGAMLLGYAFLVLASLAISAALFDFKDVGEILPNGSLFTLTPAAELWPEVRAALVAPVLPLCALTMLGFLAGSLARTGAGALGLALGSFAALDLSRTLLRGVHGEAWIPSAYLPSPLADTSFIGFYVQVSRGLSDARFALGDTQVLVPLAWTLFAVLLAALRLARKPIP